MVGHRTLAAMKAQADTACVAPPSAGVREAVAAASVDAAAVPSSAVWTLGELAPREVPAAGGALRSRASVDGPYRGDNPSVAYVSGS
eukprot:797863-Pyramimonas_sp.AAC.1